MDPNKWREKAIDFVGETSKLLITLGTAFVAFTITFSEKLGGLVVDSFWGRGFLIVVWGAFAISVGCGIWTQLALTQELEPKPEPGKEMALPSIRSRPVKVAFAYQLVTFAIAMALGSVFGIWRIYQPLPRKPPIAPQASQRTELFRVGKPLLFGAAESTLRDHLTMRDLRPAICDAKRELSNSDSTVAIVIGRYDHRPLRASARLQFSSNAGLAQRRAEEVGRVLEDAGECGLPSIRTVINLIAAPRYLGVATNDPALLQRDREVTIYGLRHVSRGQSSSLLEKPGHPR